MTSNRSMWIPERALLKHIRLYKRYKKLGDCENLGIIARIISTKNIYSQKNTNCRHDTKREKSGSNKALMIKRLRKATGKISGSPGVARYRPRSTGTNVNKAVRNFIFWGGGFSTQTIQETKCWFGKDREEEQKKHGIKQSYNLAFEYLDQLFHTWFSNHILVQKNQFFIAAHRAVEI